jgi:hypothetical protein
MLYLEERRKVSEDLRREVCRMDITALAFVALLLAVSIKEFGGSRRLELLVPSQEAVAQRLAQVLVQAYRRPETPLRIPSPSGAVPVCSKNPVLVGH